jgi:hypothetical protein
MTTKAKTKKTAAKPAQPKVAQPKVAQPKVPKAEPVTFQLPAVCPNCRSATKGELITVTKVRELKGRVLGFAYQTVEWSKRQCDCGQILDVRTYSGRPNA